MRIVTKTPAWDLTQEKEDTIKVTDQNNTRICKKQLINVAIVPSGREKPNFGYKIYGMENIDRKLKFEPFLSTYHVIENPVFR
jgi:hypothetical protein